MQTLSIQDLAQYVHACSFFAEIFSAPLKEDRYQEFQKLCSDSDWTFNADKPEIQQAYGQLAQLLKDSDQLTMELEYGHIFQNLEELKAPPYSTIYLDKDLELFSDECVWVRKQYAQSGLTYDLVNREPDDALALEFAFIGFLLNEVTINEGKVANEHYQNLSTFMQQHMLVWAPICLQEAMNHDRIGFYKNIAILANDFLNQCRETFEFKPVERRLYFPRLTS